jgi:hypothetical protein
VNENCWPGEIDPEFHPIASEVDVCVSRSVFSHVTVAPTSTVRSGGVNARLPSVVAPTGIVIDDDGPAGAGEGEHVTHDSANRRRRRKIPAGPITVLADTRKNDQRLNLTSQRREASYDHRAGAVRELSV